MNEDHKKKVNKYDVVEKYESLSPEYDICFAKFKEMHQLGGNKGYYLRCKFSKKVPCVIWKSISNSYTNDKGITFRDPIEDCMISYLILEETV